MDPKVIIILVLCPVVSIISLSQLAFLSLHIVACQAISLDSFFDHTIVLQGQMFALFRKLIFH